MINFSIPSHKDEAKGNDNEHVEKLKKHYTDTTLFLLDCKEALRFIIDNYKNKELIVSDNLHYNYTVDSSIDNRLSQCISGLIHLCLEDLNYSSFYVENTDSYYYNINDKVVFDTTNYFIRLLVSKNNIQVLQDGIENLRQEHLKCFKELNDV